MNSVKVRTAAAVDEKALIATLVTAFGSDPAARWSFPDANVYLANFPSFVRAFGGKAFAHGSAHVAGAFAGAALWLPPGVDPDERAMMELFQSVAPEAIHQDGAGVFEQMARYHPEEPHWYLPLLGVDTPCQGKGYGSALLKHALAVCDADGVPAYLESSNERNIPLYERHGFKQLGTIQVGSSPKIYPMLRKAGA